MISKNIALIVCLAVVCVFAAEQTRYNSYAHPILSKIVHKDDYEDDYHGYDKHDYKGHGYDHSVPVHGSGELDIFKSFSDLISKYFYHNIDLYSILSWAGFAWAAYYVIKLFFPYLLNDLKYYVSPLIPYTGRSVEVWVDTAMKSIGDDNLKRLVKKVSDELRH